MIGSTRMARGWHWNPWRLTMKLMTTVGAALTLTLFAGASPVVSAQERKVTITGCAVKGSGDGDGFLLANTTDPAAPRILFWLDDDDDEVQKLMGQLVEVTGEVEGDIKRGEIE